MQFIANGPHIPDEVLRAQEAGNLVFFCGSGISRKLGLPDFNGLINRVREKLAINEDASLPDGIPKGEVVIDKTSREKTYPHPDLFLNYLAKHLDSDSKKGFIRVKNAIIEVLKIRKNKQSYDTHKALLKLSECNDGKYRIITTNADLGFKNAAKQLKLKNFKIDYYPYLPPADIEHLKNPVHLHGLIQEDSTNMESLIFTSADFGRAYLTDGRAAKFIAELFSGEFVVLFVGYSLADPVLRYMTDALSYDGCLKNKVFALCAYDAGDVENKLAVKEQWKFKGICPILYSNEEEHQQLRKTLIEWERINRKDVINRYSSVSPENMRNNPDMQHNISWVTWALNDRDGGTAKYFSEITPPPPIGWLQEFKDNNLLSCEIEFNESCVYCSDGRDFSYPFNNMQKHLLAWIKKHLDKPETELKLFQFIISNGGIFHRELRSIIQNHLQSSPDRNTPLNQSWLLLLRQRTPRQIQFTQSDDVRTLLEAIKPFVRITPFSNEQEKRSCSVYNDPRKYARISVEFQDDFEAAYRYLIKNRKVLFEILLEPTYILKNLYDMQVLYMPNLYGKGVMQSIRDCERNKTTVNNKWTKIIELVRDSWKELLKLDLRQARSVSDYWISNKHVIFRRLVLYAMTESDLYSSGEILDYLLEDSGKWLWDSEIKCERYELIERKCQHFSQMQIYRLIEFAFERYAANNMKIGYYLFWFLFDIKQHKKSDLILSEKAVNFLEENRSRWERAEWQKRSSVGPCVGGWIGENSDLSSDELCQLCPEKLLSVLVGEPKTNYCLNEHEERKSAWSSGLKDHPESAIKLAKYLLSEDLLTDVEEIWGLVFYGLNDNKESFEVLSDAITRLSINLLTFENIHAITSWLKSVVSIIETKQIKSFLELVSGKFLTLEKKVLIPNEDNSGNSDALNDAINSPIGHMLESLVILIGRQANETGILIPEKFKMILQDMIEYIGRKPSYPYAIFGSALYFLFSVDDKWTKENIINNMMPVKDKLEDSVLAASIWTGYLYSKRVSPDLIHILKEPLFYFICRNKDEFTKNAASELIRFFTQMCLYYPQIFTYKDIQSTLVKMCSNKLEIIAQTLASYLQSSKSPDNCWSDDIVSFVKNCWPQKEDLKTNAITISFSQIILMLDDKQEDAFRLLKKYLRKLNGQNEAGLFYLYNSSNDDQMFLKILEHIINKNNLTSANKCHLISMFGKLIENSPTISENHLFKKLYVDFGIGVE